MQSFGRFSVFPVIPERLSRLRSLAYNLWWSWQPEAQQLYSELDPVLWEEVKHNPVRFLSRVQSGPLERAAKNPQYLARYDKVLSDLDHYMASETTWFKQAHADKAGLTIAYFSPEFGLHESLPIYSGGLGVLAGDHCKEASDLDIPLVGVGFLYPQGYFVQRINADGVQEAIYEKIRFSEVPATPATTPDGREVVVHVDLPGRRVYAKVWKFQVGRVPLYLMDTDVEANQPGDRDLGSKLYVSDHALRVAQEIVLGIGGVRVLRALGIHPDVWHMNEGHSAFLGLERIRELVQDEGLAFEEARQVVAASSVFTTHTPVAAGNEAFGFELMDMFFRSYWPSLGVDREQFLNLARLDQPWGPTFSMTVLALRLSTLANGVSALHGAVSRSMWAMLWPGLPAAETPITSITNGVHTATWLSPDMDTLFKEYLGHDWYDRLDEPAFWEGIDRIPDDKLWAVHCQLKERMVEYARAQTVKHRERLGEGPRSLAEADRVLDPNALTIGFARRFATYKRATLFMRDLPRLYNILTQAGRPVQFVFAGKAHPADEPGKSLIRQVYQLSRTSQFAGKVIFLEDYDMAMARYLNAGVDVWLNNPTRPREASGTSGQKAALNGLPNWSILDGWWPEGYNGENGWAIGEDRTYASEDTQNEADMISLYDTLEHDIIPAFYNRDNGVPNTWVRIMKNTLKSLTWHFSARRMVKEYVENLYLPAANQGRGIAKNDYAAAKDLLAWQARVDAAWPNIGLVVDAPREGQLAVGAAIPLKAYVWLGSLTPSDIRVEAVTWNIDGAGQPTDLVATPMELVGPQDGGYAYRGHVLARSSGSLAFNVRLLPSHPALAHKFATGLVKWA